MAFIRRRTLPGAAPPRYQLVMPYREGGKVRQRVASLGEHPTVEEALHALRHDIGVLEAKQAQAQERIARQRARIVDKARLARLEANRWGGWSDMKRALMDVRHCAVALPLARDRLSRLEAVVSKVTSTS
jgi:hypothetical protein